MTRAYLECTRDGDSVNFWFDNAKFPLRLIGFPNPIPNIMAYVGNLRSRGYRVLAIRDKNGNLTDDRFNVLPQPQRGESEESATAKRVLTKRWTQDL